MRIGIDIGYNATKVMGKGGASVFPSVVGSAERAVFSLNGNDEFTITLSDNSQSLIGQAAITQSVFASRREDRDWIQSREYYTLFLAAISEMVRSSRDVHIVTGLPVAFYNSDKPELQDALLGEHRFKRDNRRWQTVHVASARVIPQPFGTVLSAALNDNGKALDSVYVDGNIGIIDVGGKTTNILSVNRLTEVSRETTSVNLGGWNAVRKMRDYLDVNLPGLELRDHEISKAIMQGGTSYYGQLIDLTDIIDSIITPMAEQVISSASQLWGKAARLNAILISGGGAHLLGDYIQGYFPHSHIVEDPQFSNVSGYYKLAQR